MPFPGIPDPTEVDLPAPPAALVEALGTALSQCLSPPDAALRRVLAYGELLLAANTRTNLTGAKDWEALGPHLLDCVAAAALLPEELRSFFDWGSGGGMPGLVLAAMFPELEAHLCERRGKKAAFLQAAADALEMGQVEVHAGAGEECLPRLDPRPEWVLARAVEPLPKLLARLAAPRLLVRRLALMVGPSWQEDWPEEAQGKGPWRLESARAYAPAGATGGTRYLLLIRAARSAPRR